MGWSVGGVGHTWLWFEIFAVEVAGAAGVVTRGFGLVLKEGGKEGRKEGFSIRVGLACSMGRVG